MGLGQGHPALDGIRAIAVALVLAEHGGMPGVPGGFLGVDVFFVLSGFLITSLLLDELARTPGESALAGFWIRRARRLLPALLVMVLAVVAARRTVLARVHRNAARRRRRRVLLGGQLGVRRPADRLLLAGRPPSPLQHTWSLGVEEQYYLFWPLLVIAVAAVFGARARLGACSRSPPRAPSARPSPRSC